MNNKQKKNARKKSSVIIASSVAIGAATAAAIGTGVALNQDKITDSQIHAVPSSPVTSTNTLFVIDSAKVSFPLTGDKRNVGSFDYSADRPAFYTMYDYIKANYDAVEATKLALARGVTISGNSNTALNGTYTSADWTVSSYTVDGHTMPLLTKNPSVTSAFAEITAIEIYDASGYYTTAIDAVVKNIFTDDVTDAQGRVTKKFKDVKKYSDFLKQLDSITPTADQNNKRTLKVDNSTYDKIQSYVGSNLGLTDVGINKERLNNNDVLVVSGKNSNNDFVVYTINNLPLIYNFENLKTELPTFDEVVDANFDYQQAIYNKIQTLNTTTIFNNKINKSAVTNKESIKLLDDGTIVIEDTTVQPSKTIYITLGDEGYKFFRLNRDITSSETDPNFAYTYNLVDYESLLKTISSNGVGKNHKISLSSVYNNHLINAFLLKHNFSLSSSTIYYDVTKDSLFVVDETVGKRQAVQFYNLPKVVRSDADLIFGNAPSSNKKLFSLEQLAKKIELDATGAESLEHDALVTMSKEIARDNLALLAADVTNNKIGNYSFNEAPIISNQPVETKYLPNGSSYTYFKYDFASSSSSLYVLNANTFKAVNSNKAVFKDKNNYDTNNANVVGTYLKVSDVNLVDLNNYLTANYTGQNPDFAPSTSRVIRIENVVNGENNERFIIINNSAPTIDSKVLILYALPKTLSTTDAFNDFEAELSLEKLIEKVKEDTTHTKDIKEIYVELLNNKLKRKPGDQDKALIAGNEYTFTPTNASSPGDVKIDYDYENNKRIINLVKTADNKVVEKIRVATNPTNNQNGYIPEVKRFQWNKTDQESLAFYRLYKSLTDASIANQKILSNEILNDPFIKANIGGIKTGTIEYDRATNNIIIREQTENRAVIFYNVPKITTVQEIFANQPAGSLVNNIIKTYATSADHNTSYNPTQFLTELIKLSDSSATHDFGDYHLEKGSKSYVNSDKTEIILDKGPNNSDRRYRKYVYKLTENQNTVITIYDDTNYIDTKRAFGLYGVDSNDKSQRDADFVVWKALYDKFNELKTQNTSTPNYVPVLTFAQLKDISANLYTKLITSIDNSGFGFFDPTNTANLDQALIDKINADNKVFLISKNNTMQIFVAGWRNNSIEAYNATSNPAEFAVLAVNEIPNVYSVDQIQSELRTKKNDQNFVFELPINQKSTNTNEEIIEKFIKEIMDSDGDYDKALKAKLESLINTNDNDNYDLPFGFTSNDSLKLNKTLLRWEIDSQGRYIRLYRGSPTASFGSLTIFVDDIINQKIPTVIGTNYIKKTEHELTYKYWSTFGNPNATAVEKQNALTELVGFQNEADAKFKEFNFNVSSNSGVEVFYDENKFVLYENINDKLQSRMVVVYGVQKVATTHELFESNTTAENTIIQVLKEPNKGDLVKAIDEKLKDLSSLVSNGKILNYSNIDTTKTASYNDGTKRITFKDSNNKDIIVNIISPDIFIVKNEKIFTNPNRYKELIVNQLQDFANKQPFATHELKDDIVAAKTASSNDLPNPTHIFKVGTKIVFEGIKDNKPTYVIFVGSPEIATDLGSGIEWLDVFAAIDYTNKKSVFNTSNLDELLVQAFKNKDAKEEPDNSIIAPKLNHTKNDNKVVIDNREIDITKMSLRVNRSETDSNIIKYITISYNGEIELVIEDSNKISQLSSANIDATISLNSVENINKIITLVDTLKQAANSSNITNGTKKLIDYGTVASVLDELKPQSSTFDRVWYDEEKQVIWLINTSKNFAHAVTNVPSNIVLNIDDKTTPTDASAQPELVNAFFALNKLKDYNLRASEMLENYVSDISNNNKVVSGFAISEPVTFEPIAGTNNLYLITHGANAKRLVIKDATIYNLEKTNGIDARTKLTNSEQLKVIYDLLPINEVKKYSELNQTNTELEAIFTEHNLDKENIWLVSQVYQNNSVILMMSKSATETKVYLIHDLPKIAQPSKVKIPTVYSFVKYKGNDDFKFKSAIKDALDTSNNKINANVDIYGTNVPWDSASVVINRDTKTIKVSDNSNSDLFDTNTFEFLPEYKTLSLSGADNKKVYELIKKLKALATESTLDASSDNEQVNNVRKQKVLEPSVKDDELITAKINEANFASDFSDLSRVSVEYYLDSTKTKNDKIIFRIFDAQNNLVKALVIDDVARVVKNATTDAELNISEDDFISAIVEHNDPSQAVTKKLIDLRGVGNQSASKLGELYEYGDSLLVQQNHNDFLLTDLNGIYLPVAILNDIDYVPSPASVFDAISDIKKYYAAYKLIDAEANKTKALRDLDAPELVTFVNDFGGGMLPDEVNVELKNNRLLFKTTTKVLVGIDLPKVLEVTQDNDDKVPAFDKIVEGLDSSKTVLNIYNEFFKDTGKFPVSDEKIDVTVTNASGTPANTYKIKVEDLVVKFNDDGSIELNSRSTKETIYIILKPKNEDLNIIPINANVNDANETFDLVKLITSGETQMDVSEDMKQTSFIKEEPNIPQNFFGASDEIKIKYLKDLNKIVIENNTQNKSIVFYNVARVVEANQAYTVDEVVTADKRLQVFIAENVNKDDSSIKTKIKQNANFDINTGSDSSLVKVTNVGADNNSTLSMPGDNSKIQVTILDKTIYHLGFEKISAKNELVSYVAFDNYHKTLTTNDFVAVSDTIPSELKRIVFNPNYGNIDFATAKVKRIGTSNTDYKLIFKGTNKSNKLEHIIVVHDFPEVYNPTGTNDLPVPSVEQLTSVDGLESTAVYDAQAIMLNVLRKVLANGDPASDTTKVFHTQINAKDASITVNRPQDNQEDLNTNYSYSVTSAAGGDTTSLVPSRQVPVVYGTDASRLNSSKLDLSEFEAKYYELLIAATNNGGKVMWSAIKDNKLLSSYISDTSTLDEKVKTLLKDDSKTADAYVKFDKPNNRILILSETSRFLVIFGNQYRVATNNNAIIADPLNPDNATNPNPLYKHGEVVEKAGNLNNVILEKLNGLNSNDVTVNGYSLTKNFERASASEGVFEFTDSSSDHNSLFFIDETVYETKDLTTYAFTNLVDFYNKTVKRLEGLDKYTEGDASLADSQDLTNIVNTLNFTSDTAKIVLGGEKLAIIGTDATSNKTKVYILDLPVVENIDFEITADKLVDAPGSTTEEKLANLVKDELKKKANDTGVVTIAGKEVNVNDETLKYVTKTDPSNPDNKIVEIVKDGKVLGTLVMNGNLPSVKTINWNTTNATPLQTWNILWNIITKNRALDASKPNRKAIEWTDFTNTLSQDKTLFSIDVIKNTLTNNQAEAILNENAKSIEYNKERNEIILRTENSTVIFVNVLKVVNVAELFNGAQGYVSSETNETISPETKSSINALKEVFNNLDQDFNTNTKVLKDGLDIAHSISVEAQLESVSAQYKDSLVYKFSMENQEPIYVIDTRQYVLQPIDALESFQDNVANFLALKERMSESEFKPVTEYNDPIINQYVNDNQLIDAKIIKTKVNDSDVFVLVGSKQIQRDQVNGTQTNSVNELVEYVYLINNLPEVPNNSVYDLLPSDSDVVANGGDQGQLVSNALSDPNKFPRSGNPPAIDFGGTKLTLPIASSEVQSDGSIKVTDANGKVIIIPAKPNQTIYKEYDVNPLVPATQGVAQDFRFDQIVEAKLLLDLLDNTPFKKGDEHALSDAFKQNALLKKILDDYANNYYRPNVNKDWDLANATISYNRNTDSILIKDNNTTENENPRVLILRNVPKIIYASDLSSSTKDYYIDIANKNNNVVEYLKDKIATIIQNNTGTTSYFIGSSKQNENNVISGYDKISNPVVDEEAYADSPNTWTITFFNEERDINNAKLFIVDKTQYVTLPQPIVFNDLIALDTQIKALDANEESEFSAINNEEIINATKQIFGDPLPQNLNVVVIDNGSKLIVLQKDENGNVIKDFLIELPKLIDQRKSKLPTKDDVFNSNKSLEELILDNFKDNKKFNPDADGNIDLDGLKFNPNDVEIQTTPEGLVKIIKKGTDPKEVLGTIVATNPVFPQRVIIDNTEELFKLERNPYEIYDLTRLINALPTNVNNFIRLTDEMKAIAWLKNKLDHAYPNNSTWYTTENTRIKYDIENNKIIIDNNDLADNKVLVITNVDRVLKTIEREYKLYDYVDLAEAFNIENALSYKNDTLTAEEIIKKGMVKALLKINFEKAVNSYEIVLKEENTIETSDIEFIAHDNTIYKYADNDPQYKRYVKWTTKDQTYIILDENYVTYSKLNAKETFRDNIKFKTLFEAIIKSNNNLELTQEVIDNTPEIQAWIDAIKQDANFDWEQPKFISFASGPNLVLKITKDNINHINVISDIPRVVSEKDIGLNIPNDEEVVKSGGDYAQAILNKINNPAQFPRNAEGKITINDTEVDPQNIDVRVREDGSIELYDKTNENLVISINPSAKQPNYTITNATLTDAVVAKELYELIKKTHPLLKSKPRQKALNDEFVDESKRLLNNQWIKTNIIDVYSVENNPANIKTDFSTWSVEYVPNEDKLVFRGKNTDLEKREQVIVVNDVIKVIYASELYVSREVFKNESPSLNIDQALSLTINNALVNKESIGDYDVINPVLDTNKYTNTHAQDDMSQSNEYSQLLSNNKQIVIIDNIKYLDSVDGYSIFKDLDALGVLINDLEFNKGLEIALFNNQTPPTALNQEVLAHMSELATNQDSLITSATIGLFDDFMLIKAKDANNRVFVQKITNLPKVLNKTAIQYPSIDDIVNADGDLALAMSNLLKDPSKYKRNENNNIVFNGKEVNPDNLIVELDENNNVVVYEKDANGNKIEPSIAIILTSNKDSNEPTIKFRNVDGQKYWPSYLQEIISSVYRVEENRTITNIKPLSEVLNNKIVQELIKTEFNLNEQATVEYKLDKNQIIIRDNDQQNQNVIIISTKSLQHSQQTPAELVEYESKKDYWMIWVAITSIVGGIGLIILIGLSIYWFNKKPKTTKIKNKK